MNLHDIAFNGRKAWMWVNVSGRRYIGTHLYFIEEGTIPPLTPKPNPRITWWTPPRWMWKPFETNLMNLFPHGTYVQPLCGKKSRAQDVRGSRHYEGGWRDERCRDCATIARDRGYAIQSWTNLEETSPAWTTARVEYMAWDAAGRPILTDENLATFANPTTNPRNERNELRAAIEAARIRLTNNQTLTFNTTTTIT